MALSRMHGMALLRIGFGLYFFATAIDKLSKGWLTDPGPMSQFVGGALQRGQAEAFYRPFLEGVVLPNALLFSRSVALGELLVGISLVLGLFTVLGSLGSAFMVLNYMLMKGLLNNAGSNDRLFLLASVVFIVTSAGLVWGLDGQWRGVLARSALLRWLTGPADQLPERRAAGFNS
jgi:thiosulfate dehydrogenase (quinone) large subunit